MDTNKKSTDPRILRTRQLIREAFVELLHEMDIEKISVNRITEKAAINRGTFYLHYRDIPDMLEKMAHEMVDHLRRIIDAPLLPAKSEEEWPALVRLLEHIAEYSNFYRLVLSTRRTPVFTDKLFQLLTEMITARLENDSSLVEAGIERDIAIWYKSSALIGTIISWLRNDMPYMPIYLAKHITKLHNQQLRA